MKFYLAKWQPGVIATFCCFLLFDLLYVLFTAELLLPWDNWNIIFFYPFFMQIIVLPLCFFAVRKNFVHVTISENKVDCYLFKKKKCTVDLTKTVYYVAFNHHNKIIHSVDIIILSNEPFEYKIRTSFFERIRTLRDYDMKKQVAMREDKAIELLNFSNWICIDDM